MKNRRTKFVILAVNPDGQPAVYGTEHGGAYPSQAMAESRKRILEKEIPGVRAQIFPITGVSTNAILPPVMKNTWHDDATRYQALADPLFDDVRIAVTKENGEVVMPGSKPEADALIDAAVERALKESEDVWH